MLVLGERRQWSGKSPSGFCASFMGIWSWQRVGHERVAAQDCLAVQAHRNMSSPQRLLRVTPSLALACSHPYSTHLLTRHEGHERGVSSVS